MSRLKIIACYTVERIGNVLQEAQVMVRDIKTLKEFEVRCNLGESDSYEVEVSSMPGNNVVDTCVVDSSGGVLMGNEFACTELDEELGNEILELLLNHFIVEF